MGLVRDIVIIAVVGVGAYYVYEHLKKEDKDIVNA